MNLYIGRGTLKIFTKWCLIECGRELATYYCTLYNKEYFYRPKLQAPLWGAHISVIRGETILDPAIKAELEDMSIEFYYRPEMDNNGCHFYLPVIAPLLDDIREEFSLSGTTVPYHLSIGNLRNTND